MGAAGGNENGNGSWNGNPLFFLFLFLSSFHLIRGFSIDC